jgi:hypothetical protein
MSPAASALRVVAIVALIVVLVPWGIAPRADEGMWPVQDLSRCPFDNWRERGLELDPTGIEALADAIIQLGGGTGSFISGEGLIATNHHVAYRAIQQNSDVDSDRLAAGFLAESRGDEIPAPGFEGKVLLGVEDVTDEILGGLDENMSGAERYDAINKAENAVVARAEKDRDVYCEVKPFYGGSQYLLYTYFRIKDLRLVYAPPASIGVYGGEIDNWMWPRHTGDFSFVRAYVAPDGSSAEYSEDNVPFHPRRHLAVSRGLLAEGDLTMTLGYPGTTRRYRTSHSIEFFVDHYYPRRIEYFGDVLDIMDEEAKRGREVEIKVAGAQRGLANAWKNYQGMLEGLRRDNLVAKKVDEEAALKEFAKKHEEYRDDAAAIDDLGALYDDYLTFWEPRALLSSLEYASPTMKAASTIYKWAVEREKADADREHGYQDRDERRVRRTLVNLSANLDVPTDRRVFAYFMGELAEAGFAGLAEGADGVAAGASAEEIAVLTDRLYAGTRLTDEDARMAMFGMSHQELLDTGDPFIEFVAGIHDAREALDDRYESFSGVLQALRPKVMELREAASDGALYPDANFTMRLSVGEIKGYSPRDAVTYGWQTTLTGAMEKYTGEEPFDMPAKLRALYADGDFGPYLDPTIDDVPVCFLTTNDITGGNSGSPVLNGRGELIGLVFDGNFESISADYDFVPALTRAIHVDTRYMLFLLDKFAGANALLEELDITGGMHGSGQRTDAGAATDERGMRH